MSRSTPASAPTPGPWWVDPESRLVHQGDPIFGPVICRVHGGDAEHDANARLIAAAPALRAVAAAALAWFDAPDGPDWEGAYRLVERLRAAMDGAAGADPRR